MSYRVRLASSVRRRLPTWGLPDSILVEVHLRLTNDLAQNPAQRLVRTGGPYDGMTYRFSLIDPGDRFSEYRFQFQVYYSRDEETLEVARGGFIRRQVR